MNYSEYIEVPKSSYELQNNIPSIYPQFPSSDNDAEQKLLPWMTYPGHENDPIYLYKKYGGAYGTYQPSIIRPLDNVHIDNSPIKFPNDIKRDPIKCEWPCYAKNKFQTWCSEENAINYFAMRPLLTTEKYNNLLKKLFEIMVMLSQNEFIKNKNNMQLLNYIKTEKMQFNLNSYHNTKLYAAIFNSIDKENLMNYIMRIVAESVILIPQMQKNSSWKSEQFYYTDAVVYEFTGKESPVKFFKIVFNLYNPLRSTSNNVVATLILGQSDILLYDIHDISQESMNENSPYGHNLNDNHMSIYVPITNNELKDSSPIENGPEEIKWNYMNTLLDQEFNKYGYYDPGHNQDIQGSISPNLQKQVELFERNSNEYLLSCGTVRTNINGVPQTSSANQSEVFNVNMNRLDNRQNNRPISEIKPVGFVNYTS